MSSPSPALTRNRVLHCLQRADLPASSSDTVKTFPQFALGQRVTSGITSHPHVSFENTCH